MKTYSLIILFIILQLSSCCIPPQDDILFSIRDMEAANTHQFIEIEEGSTINQEEYRIKCIPSDSFVETVNDIRDIRKTIDYCENYSEVIKGKIAGLTISCNKDIWNTPSGNPLNNDNISFVHYENQTEGRTSFSNAEWVDILNNEEQFTSFEWYIEFNEGIILGEYVQFELLFELANGNMYGIETELVKFE